VPRDFILISLCLGELILLGRSCIVLDVSKDWFLMEISSRKNVKSKAQTSEAWHNCNIILQFKAGKRSNLISQWAIIDKVQIFSRFIKQYFQ